MTDTLITKGSCLCGVVTISANNISNKISACHCNICRRWGGGPLLVIDVKDNVSFTGEKNIGIFNSSDWAERGFCKQCGTHLFYRFKANNQYFIPVGLLTNTQNLIFDHQVFIDEKPKYYSFANETHNLTGAEIFAQFSDND